MDSIAKQVGCTPQAAMRYLRRAKRLQEAGHLPGSRPKKGLRAWDVSTYVSVKEGRSRAETAEAQVPEGHRDRAGLCFLIVEGRRQGVFPAGHALIEEAMHRPSAQVLCWTGLRSREGQRIWEGDHVRPDGGFPWQKVWWDKKLLRWQAGRELSLATLASLTEKCLQKKPTEQSES